MDSPQNRQFFLKTACSESGCNLQTIPIARDANPFRVRAYRSGANRVRRLDQSMAEMVINGDGEALQALPDIGEGLARVITRYVHTGRSQLLNRLQGEVSPEKVLQQVPGLGPQLAGRITRQLYIL